LSKKIVHSKKVSSFPMFSQGVKAGPFLWVSGQTANDFKTGKLVNETFEQEVEQCILNIMYILEASKYTLEDVIKVNISMIDLGLFNQMNQVYLKYFANNPPARAAVQVARLVGGAKIEIEAIAYKED